METLIRLFTTNFVFKMVGVLPYKVENGRVVADTWVIVNNLVLNTVVVLILSQMVNASSITGFNYFTDDYWIISYLELFSIVTVRLLVSVESLLRVDSFDEIRELLRSLRSTGSRSEDDVRRDCRKSVAFRVARDLSQLTYEILFIHDFSNNNLIYQLLSYTPLVCVQLGSVVFSSCLDMVRVYLAELEASLGDVNFNKPIDCRTTLESSNRLLDLGEAVGRAFGLRNLLTVAAGFSISLLNSYTVCYRLLKPTKKNFLVNLSELHWTSLWLAEVFTIFYSVHKFTNQVEELEAELDRVLKRNSRRCSKLNMERMCNHFTLRRRPKFTACRIFHIQPVFISTFVGSLLTYLMILIGLGNYNIQ